MAVLFGPPSKVTVSSTPMRAMRRGDGLIFFSVEASMPTMVRLRDAARRPRMVMMQLAESHSHEVRRRKGLAKPRCPWERR